MSIRVNSCNYCLKNIAGKIRIRSPVTISVRNPNPKTGGMIILKSTTPISAPHKSAAYKTIPPCLIFCIRRANIVKQVPTHKPQMVFNTNEKIITCDGKTGHGRNVIAHSVAHKIMTAVGRKIFLVVTNFSIVYDAIARPNIKPANNTPIE